MPGLKVLKLGNGPCNQTTTGVTAEGLVALAHHCPDLLLLRIHLQAASLNTSLASPGVTPNADSTRSECALTDLIVGAIPVPEVSVSTISLTLLRIFPRIETIHGTDERWVEVENTIYDSR